MFVHWFDEAHDKRAAPKEGRQLIKIKRHQVKRIPFSRYLCVVIYQLNRSTINVYPPFTNSTYNSVDIHIYLANKRHAPLLHFEERREKKTSKKTINENAIKIIRRFFPFLVERHFM